MTTPVPIVPITDVILDEATVNQLFFDIAHAAELLGVVMKSPGARRANGDPQNRDTLDDAHRAFRARAVAAVQLRYVVNGEEWWDTLTHTDGGVRLIRISHSRARQAPPTA